GRGVGELLVKAALDQAKADGYTEIYLEMNSRFLRSVQLYRKFGFVLAPFDGAPRYGRSDLLLKRSL
ncbi:MAG: GNAT family N-acetyltransferase, partial [Cyanobacteria bacterium HKST-UBA06]|nr:GNAT family N-acetyltransferase [Cyanobacteria bacterium HKST-UBA06]